MEYNYAKMLKNIILCQFTPSLLTHKRGIKMESFLDRTELLIGKEGIKKLQNCNVTVLGIGGVGSYVAEALVRSGIGSIVLIDQDTVDITNCNRQLIADTTTIGLPKVDVAKARYLAINPNLEIKVHTAFYNDETKDTLISKNTTYIADCIDTVSSKLTLIQQANMLHLPIISSMGTGNKLDPNKLEITDIYQTHTCPLAKIIRKECKRLGISKLKVVFSTENPIATSCSLAGKPTPSSISFVPSVAGLLMASEIVKDILK